MHMHHMGVHNLHSRGPDFRTVRYQYPGPLMGHLQGPPPMSYSAPMPPPRGGPPGGQIARAVSRSSSESSVDSGSDNRVDGGMRINVNGHWKESKTNTCPKENPKKPLGSLGTEEKTAVAAILSLKSSSEEESCDGTSLTDDFAVIDAISDVLPSNLNNAFSQASTHHDHFDNQQTLRTVAV
jgi:hypothetical protein